MSSLRLVLALGLTACATSCARTVYTHLTPSNTVAPHHHDVDRSSPTEWRHFFVYGLAPNEMVIDAASYCGGPAHVDRIETQQSFVQGLIEAVAGYYINIYSPYTGRVVCDYHVRR